MHIGKTGLIAAFAFVMLLTGPAALSFAKGAEGGHAGSGHAGSGASGGHHDTDEGGGSHEDGSHEDSSGGDSHEGGHSGGKGKGPKYMGGRTDHKGHTDSEHGVEDDVFHGKHGVRWSDDWKGQDEHDSEEVLEDGHSHH